AQPRPQGPPPGGGPLVRLPLPLNQLFIINFAGFVLLVLLFWFGPRLVGLNRRLVDALIALWAIGTALGWADIGRPNPMGLGLIARGIEVVLLIALIVHASTQTSPSREVARAA